MAREFLLAFFSDAGLQLRFVSLSVTAAGSNNSSLPATPMGNALNEHFTCMGQSLVMIIL